MIVTVTLNASLDKTYAVPGFGVGRDVVATRIEYSPGGKGLNVASFAHTLGADVLATGILAGHTGRHVLDLLTARNISHDFVHVAGESRNCHIIHDPESDSLSQIREAGPVVSPAARAAMVDKIRALAPKARIVIFSGSIPPGLGADAYKELISIVRAAGVPTILDAAGELLELGLQAKPDLIKPNLAELHQIATRLGLPEATLPSTRDNTDSISSPLFEPADKQEMRHWAAKLSLILQDRYGVNVIASLGPLGAVVVDDGTAYSVVPPTIDPVNTVSCGDAVVAGTAVGYDRGYALADAVQLGIATGTAKALLFETGKVNPDDVTEILLRVEVVPLP